MLINQNANIGNRKAENRLVIQPMEGCDGTPEGGIGELTERRYLRFAESGAGIIWFEAVAVCEEGRANPNQLWLKEENLREFRDLIVEVKTAAKRKFGYEPLIIMQATHSGRYSKPHGLAQPIIAYRNSVYEVGKEDLPYRIITDEECAGMAQTYAESARLAEAAGFDGIDIKCCHGYLFNEFLSAYGRAGKYGGSLNNRTRLYFECIDAVKAAIGKDMIVTTRLNAYDGFDYPYGFGVNAKNEIDLSEAAEVIESLKERGIELINITIGNPYLLPSINRPYVGGTEDGMVGVKRITEITERLQKRFPDMKFVMSGLTFTGVNAVDFAEECLREGKCGFVGFGRMAFAYPEFYADYLKNGKLDKNKICVKCGNCSKMMRAGGVAGCPVRDGGIYLPLYRKYVGESR